MLAIALLHPLILLLVAVLVGLIVIYCVGLFITDPKIITVVQILVGLIVLLYGLSLFGIIA
jgi:hypothetical protein